MFQREGVDKQKDQVGDYFEGNIKKKNERERDPVINYVEILIETLKEEVIRNERLQNYSD